MWIIKFLIVLLKFTKRKLYNCGVDYSLELQTNTLLLMNYKLGLIGWLQRSGPVFYEIRRKVTQRFAHFNFNSKFNFVTDAIYIKIISEGLTIGATVSCNLQYVCSNLKIIFSYNLTAMVFK